jgi:nucleoside-diphosphate-sugar epimerase
LRYFNVYGERQNPQGSYAAVVPKFKLCMKTNTPITIFGDGLQRRDFVPVETVVQANIHAGLMAQNASCAETFNVATGTSITLLDLVDTLKTEYPEFSAGVRFQPARTGDIYSSQADCRKLKQLLEHTVE